MIERLLEEIDTSNGFPTIPDYMSDDGPEYSTLFLLGALEKKCPKKLRNKDFPKKSLELSFFTNIGNYIDGKYEGYIQIYQINPYEKPKLYEFAESTLWKNKDGLIRLSANQEYYIPFIGKDQLSHAIVEDSLMDKIKEFCDDDIDAERSNYLNILLRELCEKFMVTSVFHELSKKVRNEFSLEVFPLGYKKPDKFPLTKTDKILYYTTLGTIALGGLFIISQLF